MKTILLILSGLVLPFTIQAQKITISAANIINVTVKGNAKALADEQDVAGDPRSGQGGKPVTYFSCSTKAQVYYPLEVIVDLFATYNITDLYLYDINNIDSLFISTGAPGDWTTVIRMSTEKYMNWRGFPVNRNTRYLKLRFKNQGALISEIVLYGKPAGDIVLPTTPAPVAMPRLPMEDFIGINSFNDVPDSLNMVARHIREYHNWGWDEGNADKTYTGFPDNRYGWSPSWVSGTGWGWNFDAFYGNARKKGLNVCPALQLSAPYIVNFDSSKLNNKPVAGGDSEDPFSYKNHADWMYQFAARYGTLVSIPSSTLKLRLDNPVKAGMGYLKYMENWNEPDKNWLGKDAYFSPFEFAAMSSADYDGHMSAMGRTFGVKNADPSMKMVMGGLANADTSYIRSMICWSRFFRKGSFPADVLNFHHYSNDGEGQGGSQTKALSPEEDSLKEKVAALVAFRDRELPGKEIWFSEFGYDTHPASVQAAPAVGDLDSWETQARWIIRSYLAIAAGGADRAFMYMLRNVSNTSSTKFRSCGLTTAPSGDASYPAYTKKNSWYYLYTFRKRLTGYVFKEEVPSGNAHVRIYAFEKLSDPTRQIYAVWAPTREDLTVSDFALDLPHALSVTKVELTHRDTSGVEQQLSVSDGKVILEVDEKPDLLLVVNASVATGVLAAPAGKLKVYPNPSRDKVFVELPEQEADIILRDLRGLPLKEAKLRDGKGAVSVEELPAGIYFLEVKTLAGREVIKFVKGG